MAASKSESLVHAVYFTLKDRSDGAKDRLVAACYEYLNDHPGTVHFSAGRRAEAYQRAVNDTQYDVGLILTFATVADHDRYQDSERHKKFISEQSDSWAEVRVFDTSG